MGCDNRHPDCLNDGVMVEGRWIGRQHLAVDLLTPEAPRHAPHFTARPLADLALLAWTLRQLHQEKRHASQQEATCTQCQLFQALVTDRDKAS